MAFSNSKLILRKNPSALIRKGGLIWRKLLLSDVKEVLSINRDAITSDEILICFKTNDGKDFFISEFDKCFDEIISELETVFPGINRWTKVGEGDPLRHRVLLLWRSG